jgi:hypothetical protein
LRHNSSQQQLSSSSFVSPDQNDTISVGSLPFSLDSKPQFGQFTPNQPLQQQQQHPPPHQHVPPPGYHPYHYPQQHMSPGMGGNMGNPYYRPITPQSVHSSNSSRHSHQTYNTNLSSQQQPSLTSSQRGGSNNQKETKPNNAKQIPNISITDGEIFGIIVYLLTTQPLIAVGKLGSSIHEVAQDHTIPAYLKSKYGGLKKLLESRPDLFVLQNDHPFNPTVILRVSEDNLPSYVTKFDPESVKKKLANKAAAEAGLTQPTQQRAKDTTFASPQQQPQPQQHHSQQGSFTPSLSGKQ